MSARKRSDWDRRNISGNYAALLVAHFVSALFSLGSVWLITRSLGGEGYGWVVAVIAASQTAQIFLNWTGLAVVRFGVDEFIDDGSIARVFWSRFAILVISGLLVFAGSGLWYPKLSDLLELPPNALLLVLLHIALSVAWMHVQMGLQAVKMPRVQGFLLLFERIAIFAALIGLILAGWMSPEWAIACYLAGPLLTSIVGLLKIRSFIFRRFSIDAPFVKKVLGFSLPLLPMAVIGFFSGNYIDAIFITEFLSTRDLGIYSVAAQVNGMMLQLPTIANTLLLPFFVTIQKEDGRDRLENYFRNVLPGITALWAFGCTIVALAAYFILPLVFGGEFGAASPALWVLFCASATALPALLGYFPFTQSISATYVSLIGACFAALANIAANLLLIPRYGLIGCAAATMISYTVNVTASAILLRAKAKLALAWNLLAIGPSAAGGLTMLMTGSVGAAAAATLLLLAVLFTLKRQAFFAGGTVAYAMIKEALARPGPREKRSAR